MLKRKLWVLCTSHRLVVPSVFSLPNRLSAVSICALRIFLITVFWKLVRLNFFVLGGILLT